MKMTMRVATLFVAVLALAGPLAQAQTHVMQNVSATTWGPAPPMLPPGAQIAVLSGNPMGNSAYVVRLKFPANYTIPAHSHPTDENVAVVSGKLLMGMGDKVDKASAQAMVPGGFALMPAGANHFAYTTGETTILLFGQGPVEFKYVNAADDPRNAAPTK